MKRFLLTATALITAAFAVGCGDDNSDKGSAATALTGALTGQPTTTGVTTNSNGDVVCNSVKQPKAKKIKPLKKPKGELNDEKLYTATIKTNCGTIEIELDNGVSPNTTASFVSLAKKDFYNKTTFHRIVSDFVIQGGDPEGTGAGDPGYTVTDVPPDTTKYTRGVVAMGKTDLQEPGTAGSQFFIVTAKDAELPPDYAVLGKVTDGFKTIDAIEALPVTDEKPNQAVVIEKITIKQS